MGDGHRGEKERKGGKRVSHHKQLWGGGYRIGTHAKQPKGVSREEKRSG